MAIQYVGGASGGRAGSTSTTSQSLTGLTGGIASAPANGDLILVGVMVASQGRNPTCAISGWSTVGTQLNVTSTTYDTSLQVSYLRAGASPPTSVTIPSTGNIADGQSWVVHVFRGVDATTPLDVSVTSATGTATTKANPASITPTTFDSVVLAIGGGAAQTSATFTATGLTNFLTNAASDTNDSSIGGGFTRWYESGALDIAAFGGGNTNAANSWAAWTIALRPEATTLYYVVYPSAGGEPTATQIKAGQDATGSAATASGNEAARDTSGEEVFASAAIGLSASTGYKVSLVWSDGTNDSNVVTSSEFTTAAAPIAVPLASLTLSGKTPTVVATANKWIDVPAGSLTLAALAPTVQATASKWVDVPAAGLSLAAQTPTVAKTENVWIEPPAASLAVQGYAPTVVKTQSVWIDVPVAALTVSGQAPSVAATDSKWLDVPAASLSVQAYAPTVGVAANVTVQVPAASLALAGSAPTVATTDSKWIEVPAAGVTAQAYAPNVAATDHVTVAVPSAAIGATAYAPSVLAGGDVAIQVPAAALALAGLAPVVVGQESKRFGFAGGYRYSIRLGRDLVYADSPQALQAAIAEYEASLAKQAKARAARLAKEKPAASPKSIRRKLPRIAVVEAQGEAEQAREYAREANARIRALHEAEMLSALIAVNLELVEDENAALAALL